MLCKTGISRLLAAVSYQKNFIVFPIIRTEIRRPISLKGHKCDVYV